MKEKSSNKKNVVADEAKELDDLDEWEMDEDMLDVVDQKKQPEKDDGKVNAQEIADKKRRDLFFGGAAEDSDGLEELKMLGGNDFDNKNEDKFNQVLSTSKENGGLLASIGLKKAGEDGDSIGEESQEEDPHKKSDLFDTSKDRGKVGAAKKDNSESEDADFDLGFNSAKEGGLDDKEQDRIEGADAMSDSNDLDMPEE